MVGEREVQGGGEGLLDARRGLVGCKARFDGSGCELAVDGAAGREDFILAGRGETMLMQVS